VDEEGEDGGVDQELQAPDDFRDLDWTLREGCGKTVAEIAGSAQQFLDHLRREEEWAWLMLRDGYFPDPDQRVPLSTLAKRDQIPAWNYRAGRLGIKHDSDENVELYRNTMLGDWLEQALGRAISVEIIDCVRAAIEILGYQALMD
jgi:hypothetical protein